MIYCDSTSNAKFNKSEVLLINKSQVGIAIIMKEQGSLTLNASLFNCTLHYSEEET